MSSIVTTDWTGSSSQRREQGVCRPPQHEPHSDGRFFIEQGSRCSIREVGKRHWRPFVTRKPLHFDRYEYIERKERSMVFRELGYQLMVKRHIVKDLLARKPF